MSPASWSIAEDILPLAGFTAAFVMVMLLPVRPGGAVSRYAKVFLTLSILCYLVSASASIVNHWVPLTTQVQQVVTSIELLWVPFMLLSVYALYGNQRVNDVVASQHAVTRTSEMLQSVVETAPAGIVVLNDAGQITFANAEARDLLDIADEVSSTVTDAQWTVHVGDDAAGATDARPDFGALLRPQSLRDARMMVEWPDGWRRHLSVNTTAFSGDGGGVTGAVAAFVEREP
jgi:PAS domain-containing protein